MAVNPNWTRDELILALDLYFRIEHQQFVDSNPEIIQLSALLKQLEVHPKSVREENFRNPSGVTMKLANFLRLDPEYPGKGLDAGAKLDQVIWDEFKDKREELRKIANAIKVLNEQYSSEDNEITTQDLIEDEGYPEGKFLTRIHMLRERNSKVVAAKKREVLSKNGKLACEVCDFDFVDTYGDLGLNFAECHHLVPLSELKSITNTKTSDLAIVCSNCHRMLHREPTVRSIEDLRNTVLTRRSNRQG